MSTCNLLSMVYLVPLALAMFGDAKFEQDTIPTSKGDLRITFIGHGTLMFEFGGLTVHVDPVARYADYATLPKADIILVTHEHADHLDKAAIDKITAKQTVLLLTDACARQIKLGVVMKNGDIKQIKGVKIEAVPAYNIVHVRAPGQPFHPKGVGNGYVITFGDKRVYVAGDTENIPEMARLAGVDCALLPMNLPYTMTPEMVADAARILKPKVLYPYHFGDTDTSKLRRLLPEADKIEVRIRKMK
jgi:L-ascorbate metabolism protein UlaG (beta-lactamase superfamily)